MGGSSPNIRNYPEAFPVFLSLSYLAPFCPKPLIRDRRPRPNPQPRTELTRQTCPPLSQIARAKQIKSHFLQKTATEHSDARKANEESAKGVIVSLGLIKGEEGDDK
jgi:hypothetical protein